VVRHGQLVYERYFNGSDATTAHKSWSLAKSYSGTLVGIALDRGEIHSLDDKVSKYFPDAPASWKDITVWNLLTHTSGLGDYPPDIDLRRDYTEEQFFESFKKAPLEFAPGTNWNYSNVGYVTLGILIRKVTGKYYGDFLQERVFRPLGMTTARVISEEDIISNRASGYRLVNGELKNQEWVSPSTNSTADGSLYFSILDMAKWDAALYTDTPLTQASRNRIWTPAQLSDGTTKGYGFGWHILDLHGHRLIVHGGAWQGFKTHMLRFMDTKLTIIFLTNSWETRDFKLARALGASFYPSFALPEVRVIPDTDPKTTSLLRRVLMQFNMGKIDEQLFTPDARAVLSISEIQKRLNAFSLPAAIINSSELVGISRENNERVYRYLLTDFGSSLLCTMKLAQDGKISAINVRAL